MSKSNGKKKTVELTFGQRLAMFLCTGLVALLIAAGLSYGLWRLVAQIEHGALAAVALVAFVAVPGAFYIGCRWGDRGAAGMVHGLEKGIDTAVDAANKVADVKISTARAMRQPVIEAEVTELPPLPAVQRITAWSGNGDVIDV